MFITFEGLDCSGKSTQVKLLKEFFDLNSINSIQTKQSGGLPETEVLRQLILSNSTSDLTKTLLLLADRKEHVDKVIKPALNKNEIVICDRYVDSTQAYQVAASGISKNLITEFEMLADLPRPDLTIYLSITPQESLNRLKFKNKDCFENRPIEFITKVSNYYERLANSNKRVYSIDGTKSIQDIHKLIVRKVGDIRNYLKGERIDDLEGLIKPLSHGKEETPINKVIIPNN